MLLASLPGAEGFSHPSVVSSTLISSKLIAPIGWSLFGSTIGVLVMKVVEGNQPSAEPEPDEREPPDRSDRRSLSADRETTKDGRRLVCL